ncbi:MAG: hypothetical protein GF383_14875 [Candidatus Lokiarchaeota archaeon]|nr:hypothetical protein [Candidatus Lokiarchaeota archaeon]MBD3342699.1 hypothetical protein [Candidatus Lokiarchaeota archaeon]
MKQICDFHLHSRYLGGTSKSITIPKLVINFHLKGKDIIGTGDFIYPKWIKELRSKLIEYSGRV